MVKREIYNLVEKLNAQYNILQKIEKLVEYAPNLCPVRLHTRANLGHQFHEEEKDYNLSTNNEN